MRVLSLKQPWAWVVVHMGKDIENRRWDTAVRGDFLIHASKSMTRDEYYGCLEFCQSVVGSSAISRFPPLKVLPRGVIVGAARLVGVIPPCKECQIEDGKLLMPCGKNHGWHMPEQYGFRLENIRPAPALVECTGHLSFFRAPDDVVEGLRSAAAAALSVQPAQPGADAFVDVMPKSG